MIPQAEQQTPKGVLVAIRSRRRAWDRFSFRVSRRIPPRPQLNFRLPTSSTVTNQFLFVSSTHLTPFVVLCDGSPRTFAHQHVFLRPSFLIFKMGSFPSGNWTQRHNNKLFLLLESDPWLSSEWLELVKFLNGQRWKEDLVSWDPEL